MEAFLKSHICNEYCIEMALPKSPLHPKNFRNVLALWYVRVLAQEHFPCCNLSNSTEMFTGGVQLSPSDIKRVAKSARVMQ
jgi:hypothetical protein